MKIVWWFTFVFTLPLAAQRPINITREIQRAALANAPFSATREQIFVQEQESDSSTETILNEGTVSGKTVKIYGRPRLLVQSAFSFWGKKRAVTVKLSRSAVIGLGWSVIIKPR